MSALQSYSRSTKIGHITPSCNTVLEPLTYAMSESVTDRVSHHFARIRVEAITLQDRHTGQFATEIMLGAARLLADADVDSIMWNGTSGGWSGLDADREICAAITKETGIPASTTTLALLESVETLGTSSVGLAVPYTDDVTARMKEVYLAEGIRVVSHANLGVVGGKDMAYVPEGDLKQIIPAADHQDAGCILVVCTGLAGGPYAEQFEALLGKPVIDSVACTLWKGLQLAGFTDPVQGWGSLLAHATVGSQTRFSAVDL
jgi:maleate isomerase